MSRLLEVEVRRFFARRITRWTCVALLLGIVAVGIGTFVTSSNDVAAAHRSAQRTAEKFARQQQLAIQDCLSHVPPDQQAEQCGSDQQQPAGDQFYTDPRFSFHDQVQDLISTGVVIGSLVGLLLAASVIGAEWQAGTFAALLTWEPRRPRVAAAKVAAVVAGALAIAAVGTALLVAVGALVAATHGTFDSVLRNPAPHPHFAERTWAMVGRGACIVALVTALGAGLALLLRHTVAAVGVAIGYLIVGEGIIGGLRHGDVRHHLLQSRLDALLHGTYTWPIPVRTPDGGLAFSPDHVAVVHALAAGLEVAGVAAALLVVATVVLQRRDVT